MTSPLDAIPRLQGVYGKHPRLTAALLVVGWIVGAILFLLVSEQVGGVVEVATSVAMLLFIPPGTGGTGAPPTPDQMIISDLSSGPYL